VGGFRQSLVGGKPYSEITVLEYYGLSEMSSEKDHGFFDPQGISPRGGQRKPLIRADITLGEGKNWRLTPLGEGHGRPAPIL